MRAQSDPWPGFSQRGLLPAAVDVPPPVFVLGRGQSTAPSAAPPADEGRDPSSSGTSPTYPPISISVLTLMRSSLLAWKDLS